MYQKKQQRERVLQRQVKRVEGRLNVWRQVSGRISTLRLLVFLGGMGLSALAFFTSGPGWLWVGLLVTTMTFVAVVVWHQRVEQTILRYETWQAIKQTHLARMALDWEHLPAPLTVAQSERHALEIDLDLQGKWGLHRVLDVGVALASRERLRQWLIAGVADPATVQRRQILVAELRPRVLFRDKLALAGQLKARKNSSEAGSTVGYFPLVAHPSTLPFARRWLVVLLVAAAGNILLLGLSLAGLIVPIWPIGVLLALAVGGIVGQQLGDVFKDAAALRDMLEQWLLVFAHLEKTDYTRTPHLRQLCAPFLRQEQRPSHYLRRVSHIVNATGVRGNPVVWLLLNAFFPWDFYFTYRLEQAKADLARELPVWLNVWHELEALSGLANWGYLNPHTVLPVFQTTETSHGSIRVPVAPFSATSLGHPLISDKEKVRNDFVFTQVGQVFLITGSNMAGKSTFLRTIGLNLVLAYAGGPVDARAFTVTPGRLFTCIRVTDSLADGISYFYAEVRRLKLLLDELARPHSQPLFFFIDEIFRGTNNRERLIGSRAVLKHLVNHNGLGMVATHDLELVQLAETTTTMHNIHFREEVRDGQMIFDYKLRSGPCPTTNALKIMALAGLPVGGEQ
ncbi:MAG: hypothetical protein KA314_18615 [Chloroflexi bacterium]|nr:hypothetical protein [Chloroflexota bacterium]MBP8057846.1 hypothetical protein [Chloroflexota bacterium]